MIGINVAARRDGEQVSFLVPAVFAEELLQQVRGAAPLTGPAYPTLIKQLWAHQAALTARFLQQPWRQRRASALRHPAAAGGLHAVLGPQHAGRRQGPRVRARRVRDGHARVRLGLAHHRIADTSATRPTTAAKLGTLRFAQRYTASFANEGFGGAGDSARTAPQCHERYVDREGLPLRAVLCLSAYKKLTGLFDVSVLVATVDAPQQGVQGRFDAQGVSFDNALALAAHYLDGIPMDHGPRPRRDGRSDRSASSTCSTATAGARHAAGPPLAGHHRPRHRPATSCSTIHTSRRSTPRLASTTAALQLTVGETVNGAWVRKRRVAAGERIELAAGDVVQVGGTRLRVRRDADAVAAERPWVPEASGSVRAVLLLALLFSAWNAADLWVHDDPGGRLTDYLPVLIGGPIAVAIWAGFWSVGSKLTRHRFDFWSHSAIALLASLAMGVGGAAAAACSRSPRDGRGRAASGRSSSRRSPGRRSGRTSAASCPAVHACWRR